MVKPMVVGFCSIEMLLWVIGGVFENTCTVSEK